MTDFQARTLLQPGQKGLPLYVAPLFWMVWIVMDMFCRHKRVGWTVGKKVKRQTSKARSGCASLLKDGR